MKVYCCMKMQSCELDLRLVLCRKLTGMSQYIVVDLCNSIEISEVFINSVSCTNQCLCARLEGDTQNVSYCSSGSHL